MYWNGFNCRGYGLQIREWTFECCRCIIIELFSDFWWLHKHNGYKISTQLLGSSESAYCRDTVYKHLDLLPTHSAAFMEESCPLQYIGQMCKYYLEPLLFMTATIAVGVIHFLENRNYWLKKKKKKVDKRTKYRLGGIKGSVVSVLRCETYMCKAINCNPDTNTTD